MDIVWILLALTALGFLIGIPYVKGAQKQKPTHAEIEGKYAYVVNNKTKFKVNNEGTSLDKRNKIYLVKYKKMGL